MVFVAIESPIDAYATLKSSDWGSLQFERGSVQPLNSALHSSAKYRRLMPVGTTCAHLLAKACDSSFS